MARNLGDLARQLTISDIQRLMTIKQRLVEMEKLQAQVSVMDAQIDELSRGNRELAAGRRSGRGRRQARARAAATLRGAPKVTMRRRATARKAAARVGKGSPVSRRGRGVSGKSLEQTIIDVLKLKAKPMRFPDIQTTIVRRKLFKTKAKDFANVMRRTISSSSRIKRVSRGIYTA